MKGVGCSLTLLVDRRIGQDTPTLGQDCSGVLLDRLYKVAKDRVLDGYQNPHSVSSPLIFDSQDVLLIIGRPPRWYADIGRQIKEMSGLNQPLQNLSAIFIQPIDIDRNRLIQTGEIADAAGLGKLYMHLDPLGPRIQTVIPTVFHASLTARRSALVLPNSRPATS